MTPDVRQGPSRFDIDVVQVPTHPLCIGTYPLGQVLVNVQRLGWSRGSPDGGASAVDPTGCIMQVNDCIMIAWSTTKRTESSRRLVI